MASLAVSTQEVGEEIQGEILATIGNDQVGRLVFTDYADYRGGRTCQINLIQVSPEHQREGIATAMVAELRKQLPGSRPSQFTMNPAGRALFDRIFDRFSQPVS